MEETKVRNPDMSEIEEGRMRKYCADCKSLNIVLVKYIDGVKTKNHITVCSNEDCYRYADISLMESWQKPASIPADLLKI